MLTLLLFFLSSICPPLLLPVSFSDEIIIAGINSLYTYQFK